MIASPQIAYEGKSKSMCKEFMEIVRKRFKVDELKLKELGTDYGKLYTAKMKRLL